MIFAFGFSKKFDLSLLLIEGRVLDRCQPFGQLVSVNAHLWERLCEYVYQLTGGWGLLQFQH
jgi:hypothetical protein